MTKLEKISTLMKESKESKSYDDTDVLAVYEKPNANLDAMLGNFFIALNKCANVGLEPSDKSNNKGNKTMKIIEDKLNKLVNGDISSINIRLSSAEKYVHLMQILMSYRPMKPYTEKELYEMYEQVVVKNGAKFIEVKNDKEHESIRIFHNHMVNTTGGKSLIDDVFALKNIKETDSECKLKSKNKGNKVKDVLKVFDKGQVDIKQVIVQMYLKDLQPSAPFVNELVRKELARIKREIVENFTPIHNLDTYNLKLLASVDYIEDIKNCDSVVDLECAYMFYVYEKEIAKELRLTGKPDYSWIKDFIIQKNVMSQKRVNLFKSNKFEIFIESGSIHFVDIKPNIRYSIDIKYNEETNTFHL